MRTCSFVGTVLELVMVFTVEIYVPDIYVLNETLVETKENNVRQSHIVTSNKIRIFM